MSQFKAPLIIVTTIISLMSKGGISSEFKHSIGQPNGLSLVLLN